MRGSPVVWVLPGDFGDIVRVLVPDDRTEPRMFHDILIEKVSVRPVSAEDLAALKRRWPSSMLTAMTKRQADMESLRWNCIKAQFRQ